MHVEASTPERRALIASRSTIAPVRGLAPLRAGERYSEAELADARRRIEERRACEVVAVRPEPIVVEPPPLPIVAKLPVPIVTFVFDTRRPRTDFDVEAAA